jgi:molybdate transport repressor ModE-like protein
MNFTLHLPWPELPRGYVVFRLSPSEHRQLARVWRKQPPSTRATGRMRLTSRVDVGPAGALGPGKVSWLEAVGKTDSISQAVRTRDFVPACMALVDDMNNGSRNLVISVRPGGVHGGGATLMPFGQKPWNAIAPARAMRWTRPASTWAILNCH